MSEESILLHAMKTVSRYPRELERTAGHMKPIDTAKDYCTSGYSIFYDTLADMTWPAVEEAARRNTPLLVPVAVIEQHGPHLPLATDTYGAYLLCRLVKRGLATAGLDSVIAPPYYFGINATTSMFPGSFTISLDTMTRVLAEILENCADWGFRRQFIINHHGDPEHNRALVQVVHMLRDRGVQTTYVLGGLLGSLMDPDEPASFGGHEALQDDELIRVVDSEATGAARVRLTGSSGPDVHAGERETSLIMRYFPDTLDSEVDVHGLKPAPQGPEMLSAAVLSGGWREASPLGYIGDPAKATSENGELYELEAADISAAIAESLRPKR